MPKIMLINVTHSEESRVAIISDNLLESFEIESFGREHLKSNLYKGVVHRIHPALEAAFVDIGGERDAFLPLDEICFLNLPKPLSGGMHGNEENGRRRRRIRDILRPGEEILVQITKEQFANKPPTLTTFYSLPGRYLVLLPGSDDIGISRRIEGDERSRLRGLVERLDVPAGFGVIVRTAAGVDDESTELATDLAYLQRLWKGIQEAAAGKQAPALVYREHDIVLRTIRDFFTPDIDEIYVDNEEVFQRAREFLRSVLPGKEHVLRLYERDQPIFSAFDVESQIESIFKRRVQLRSGGSIVIDGTEALTAIDVNSGGSMRGANPEETAFRTNREAATEIARQLRLRDIGGLIVIDFIDMRESSHNQEVERTLRDAMRPDKARHEHGRISSFGLMEISRQRLRPAATATTYTACPMCEGHGAVRTTESAALVALRKVHNRVAKGDVAEIAVAVPPGVALYLLNQKRDELARLELHYSTRLQIILDEKLMPHQVEMSVQGRSTREAPVNVVAPGSFARADKPSAPQITSSRAGTPKRSSGDRSPKPANQRNPQAQRSAPPSPAVPPDNGTGKKRRRRRGRRKSPSLRAAIGIGEALAVIGRHMGLWVGGAETSPAGGSETTSAPVAGKAEETAAPASQPTRSTSSRRRGSRRAGSGTRAQTKATVTPPKHETPMSAATPPSDTAVVESVQGSPMPPSEQPASVPRKKTARATRSKKAARKPAATSRETGTVDAQPTASASNTTESAAKAKPRRSTRKTGTRTAAKAPRSSAASAKSPRATTSATTKKKAATKKVSSKPKSTTRRTRATKTTKSATAKTQHDQPANPTEDA